MIKTGFGSVDITPPVGCLLQGYFFPRVSQGIHDPLFASAFVVDDGASRICLVSCDLAGISGEEANEARRLIKEKAGIDRDKIIICGTHTHTGPIVIGLRGPKVGYEPKIDEKWMALLPSLICSAVLQALSNMREIGIACLSGEEKSVSFNRRCRMKDGTFKTNPGVGNPDILMPAGPADPEVGVLAFGSGLNDIAGIAVNFALHLDTVKGNYISADYPGVMREMIVRHLGPETGFLFTNGALGDINHTNVNRDPEKKYEYFEFPSRIGRILGAEVLKTVNRMEKFETNPVIGGASINVDVPLVEYDQDALEKSARILDEEKADLNSREFMSALSVLKASGLGKGFYPAELVALRIGDAAFVSMPGEMFVELGLYIKKNSPFPKTFVAGLGLDHLGYIAHREAYAQFGYEPTSSPLAAGAGEILADSALELLRRI